jgi:hypothetical protein
MKKAALDLIMMILHCCTRRAVAWLGRTTPYTQAGDGRVFAVDDIFLENDLPQAK